MAEVKFLVGTQTQYAAATKDTNTLYFLSDAKKIMKGADDYTASVLFVDVLPTSGQIQGKLYIVGNTGSMWNGTAWVTVFEKAVATTIVNDLTTGGADAALSAEQGKVLKTALDTHEGTLAGAAAGHVKTGADVEIADGLITVKKIGGTAWADIKKAFDDEDAKKADLAGATFTGDVKLIATPEGDTSAVTKKYVDDEISSKISANDAMRYKGTIGTGGTVTALPTTGVRVGDTYKVITAGTYAGEKCEIGDMLIALKNNASTNADWTVVQANIDGAVTGPASATDDTLVLFDGATGKIIKGSTITIATLTAAIDKAHEHDNKTQLDTYTKTMDALSTDIKNSAVTEAGTNAQNLIDALKLTDLADADIANPKDGQVVYWDNTASKWKVKTLTQVDISGKVDKMTGDTADHVVYADGNGGIKDSGKVVGGATIKATPDADTIATEEAVKAYADSVQTVWETIA